VERQDNPFVFHVNVTQRTTQAVDYRDRGGTTQVDFKGTSLMPKVDGRALVTGHTGRLAIDTRLHHLQPARSFGPEYLTYVLWAITPEGRPTNLGEVIPNDNGDAYVQVTSGLQEFGMIVTAEPYFAVTRPSDLVVAENIVRTDTAGGIHPITARYELLQKGQYTVNVSPTQLPATSLEHQKNTPLQLLEAENAIAIAQASGADQYAADTLQKAKDYLAQAQDYQRRHQGKTPIGTVARAAAQAAEDARLITLEKKQQEQVAAERQRTQQRIQQAQTQAEQETARAEAARLEAQREADQRALAEQERLAAEQARQQAEQARQQAQQELQQAEAARQAALQQQQAAEQQAQQARLQAQQAEQARLQTQQQAEQQRQRLLQQLNQVLQTKDTAKGLIVNVSDVLFDTGQATLKPGAKLRLAKVAGIILAYPDLRLQVDGYTDSTGSHQLNERLSQRRAEAVRDFLVSQGVSPTNVGAQGFAEADPVASNSTATGRQLNRRVELVVSGSAIGQNVTPAGTTTGTGGVSGAASSTTTTTPGRTTSSPGTGTIGTPASTPPSANPSGATSPTGSGTQTTNPPPAPANGTPPQQQAPPK
jgi:outer membrane protein OmpA-like peptidoglycan-associated protein